MVADLQVAVSPSSGATANAIFHYRTSPRRQSSASVKTRRDICSALVVSFRITRVCTPPSSAAKLSNHIIPLVSDAPIVPPLSLAARQSHPRRSGGLRHSGPWSGLDLRPFRCISRSSGIGCPADVLPPYRCIVHPRAL